jgi:hypothetical protein
MPIVDDRRRAPQAGRVFDPFESQAMSRRRLRERVWLHSLAGIAVFTISLTLGSIVTMKFQMDASWKRVADDFQWFILVKGSQLEVDEVGRFLKQLDGPREINYLPPEQVLEELKRDPVLGQDFGAVSAEALPPSWAVKWSIDALESHRLEDLSLEIRTFPAVLDVAYDQKTLDTIHTLRLHWAQLRVLLSAIAVAASIFLAILFGRLLFFTPLAAFDLKLLGAALLQSSLWWAAGTFAAFKAIGGIPWWWLLGGPLFGLCHFAWLSCRRAHAFQDDAR